MDKNKLIDRFSKSDEQRILLSHIYDLIIRCSDRGVITSSNFLSESEAASAEPFIKAVGNTSYILYGGYEEAERRCAVFLPEYLSEEDVKAEPSLSDIIFAVSEVDKFNADQAELSHRDVLGSLMGLGIERECIGDIVTDGGRAVFTVKTKIAPFIAENLTKISRYPVKTELFERYEMVSKQDYVTDSDTVASMRLDAVCSSVFGISRSSAQEAVGSGIVALNGITVTKSDRAVEQGDKITLRGKGRAVIESIGGLSKKGRIRFVYRRYK